MWDYSLVFVGSFLASAHCIGMCGGFALILGLHSTSWRENLAKQLIYSAGRVLTYSMLGLLVGMLGSVLINHGAAILPWQALLAIVAGLLLIWQSFRALGWKFAFWQRPKQSDDLIQVGAHKPSLACQAARGFKSLLTGPDWLNTFIAGILTGFLPCGLVYSFLALAASRARADEAWLTMVIFGFGTIPLMVLTGVGSGLLSISARQKIWKLAAVCVLMTGIISIGRGVMAWHAVQSPDPATATICPCCEK